MVYYRATKQAAVLGLTEKAELASNEPELPLKTAPTSTFDYDNVEPSELEAPGRY